jgi:hypothetical protein
MIVHTRVQPVRTRKQKQKNRKCWVHNVAMVNVLVCMMAQKREVTKLPESVNATMNIRIIRSVVFI